MSDAIDWDDLRLFYEVASLGTLAGAAARSGLSAPTIGRRMLALERVTQRELFLRRQTGYALAPDGEALFARVAAMRDAAASVETWRSEAVPLPGVNIAADFWMIRFLAGHLPELWSPAERFQLCFEAQQSRADLFHRVAHIMITTIRPETGNVAVRPAPATAYAPYCARHFDQTGHRNWVSIGRGLCDAPWANWASSQPGNWITIWADTPATLIDIVRAGGGRCVLPCLIGDSDSALVRAGPLIDGLAHDNWIVLHDDERKRGEVRLVINRLNALFADHGDLMSGQRPASAA